MNARDQYATRSPVFLRGNSEATIEMLLSGLDPNIWRTAGEVGLIIDRSPKTVLLGLRTIIINGGPVEAQVEPVHNGGGTRMLFRRLPVGGIAPLFEKRPGWDDRPIREVMDGYVPTERPILPEDEPIQLPPFSPGGGSFGGGGASGDFDDHADHGGTPHDDNEADIASRSESCSNDSSYSSDSSSSDSGSSCSTD